MTKKLSFILAMALLCIGNYTQAQCTALPLPYSQNFSSVSLGSSCSWTASTVSSGAGWMISSPAYAGSAAPEVKAYGNNACAGCVQTISLTLTSPLNTTTVTSLQLSFLHKLYVTNQATSGPGTGTLKMQTSPDGSSWTDRWSLPYTVSGSGLTSITGGTINVPAFNPGSNETYIRFTITGVMFKVWGWLIDDVSAISPITTGIQQLSNNTLVNLYPNPATDNITLDIATNDELQLQIFDYTGRLVKEQNISSTKDNSLTIPVADFSAGLYSAKITSEKTGQQQTIKFLKQ